MLIDAELMLLNKTALTATAASKARELGAAGEAVGNELFLRVVCVETATADGAATLQLQLRTAAAATGEGDTLALSSPEVLLLTPAIPKASLVAGATVLAMRLPYGVKRYFDINQVVATGPLTAGKFTAFLSFEK